MSFKPNYILLVLLLTALGACSSPRVKKPVKKIVELPAHEKQKQCKAQIKYFKLLTKLATEHLNNKYFNKATADELCSDHYTQTMHKMHLHQKKIGIIINNSPVDAEKNKYILNGLLKAIKEPRLKKLFIVKKVELKNDSVNTALAQLVLDHKVGLLMSWGDKRLVTRLQKWQKGLKIPALFIDSAVKRSKSTFRIFPNRRNYSGKLVSTLRDKQIRRIAFLTPKHAKNSLLLKMIKQQLKQEEIEIVHEVEYDSGDYGTMNLACQKIFNIDRQKRKEEYMAILKEEREKAENEGLPLNWKSVFLPAQVDYDAIFIPDNFKIVHHYIKLFEFYKAPKITLIGNHEWRSTDLLKNNKAFLEGSFFVDFIGKPADLPLLSKNTKNELEIDENLGANLDYQLMGYYTSLLGIKAIMNAGKDRSKIVRYLNSAIIHDKFFKHKPAFVRNELNWPSFSFDIDEAGINLGQK